MVDREGLIRRDPVRAVAVLLIAVSLAWRGLIAARGYLAIDDFALLTRATEAALDARYLLTPFNNHLMPGGAFVTWVVVRAFGPAYWPYIVIMLAAQAALGVAGYRLLRTMLNSGWGLLIPLCLILFSPLTLEVTSWWAVGVNLLPMQLAMVFAIGAFVGYARTGRARHLLTLGLAVVGGLLFFEKSLLIVPLLALVATFLFADGRPVAAARRFWPAWLVLVGITLGYLGLYLGRASSTLRSPASAGEVFGFFRQLLGSTLLPGLAGGPWRWLGAGDGAPVTAAPEPTRWLAWTVCLALVAYTVAIRRTAWRAWAVLGLYLVLVAGLLAVTRLGSDFSAAAGLVPRYVSDVVVVAAVCAGVALLGLVGDKPRDESPVHRHRTTLAAGLAVVLLVASAGWSSARFGDEWALKHGRDYLRTARDGLAAAPVGTVFFDAPVPEVVVGKLSHPYNLQSRFFRPLRPRPDFVTVAENPSMFDESGYVRAVRVDGVPNLPGPESGCGYKVSGGQTVRIPLERPFFAWTWAIRVAYLASTDSPATIRFGGTTARFTARRGLNQIFALVDGGGDTVEVSVLDADVTLCTNEVLIGTPHPSG